ncbi:L-methionine transporter [Coniophora puteana RWD-64-598 SS2]|uniref:L-methionine transporter n=1 Tax=Coniophora puteana (strain RWD-64-598) TaxID=741705 RepID=A0A5M3N187_CONPW|nr:L-methionine transporter [Coniophora puteana RWD-64-598 SS2]EIW85159.1 L-methionine transporter [Coniophora puteana RWD-64-598 SS2]
MPRTANRSNASKSSPDRNEYALAARHHSDDSTDSLRDLELTPGPAGAGRQEEGLSFSGFDFQRDLLPLSATLNEADYTREHGSEKNINVIHGIGLIVGLQIGSGIFSSPGVVVANTQSVGASLLCWIASGLLAWTGASSFAELGTSIPLNGGAQAYLAYAFGPLVSFLFAWTAISALKPGGNAVISLICAEYINRIFWHIASDEISPDAIPQWAIKLTAIIAVLMVAMICSATKNLGARASVVFTMLKIIALLLVIAIGLMQLIRGRLSTSLTADVWTGASHSPSAYSLALYSGLWSYDGWDQSNYVSGEMKNPGRDIPRAIHSSMAIVITLFVLANVSYFAVLDKDTVGLSNTVALDLGRAVFGSFGGTLFAVMVAISCFGALNGSTFTGSRLICAAGKDGYLPKFFGHMHQTRNTPINAIALQTGLTVIFILIGGGFRTLVNFIVVASWSFYFLTVLGLIILRVKEPLLERPYKTWIITPLTFCAVALFLLCMPIIAAPLEAIAVLVFVLAGVPVYYITHRDSDLPLPSFLRPWVDRFRRSSPAEEGWVAVATEGDEVEMDETRTSHSRR